MENGKGYPVRLKTFYTIIINNMQLNIQKEISQEKYDKIMAILAEEKGIWKPEPNETYYFIAGGGDIDRESFDYEDFDKGNLAIGNFYQTEAEALAHVEWLKAVQRIKEYIAREFGEFVPDWNNHNEIKYYILYNERDHYLKEDYTLWIKYPSIIGYLRSSEDAEQLIKDCFADLLIVFNIKLIV